MPTSSASSSLFPPHHHSPPALSQAHSAQHTPSKASRPRQRGRSPVYPDLQELTTSNYRDELFSQLETLDFDQFLYNPDTDNVFASDHLFVGDDGAFDDFTLLPATTTSDNTTTTTTSGYDLSGALLLADHHDFAESFTANKQQAAPTLIPTDFSPPDTSTFGAPASATSAELTPPTREFSWAPINTISGPIAPPPPPSLTRQSTAASSSLQPSPDMPTLPASYGFSTTTSNLPSPSSSKSPEADTNEPDGRKRKRERNTQAARRYRQRRQDRLEELEEQLAAMTKDRDELRLKLARSEAEAEILKGIVAGKK